MKTAENISTTDSASHLPAIRHVFSIAMGLSWLCLILSPWALLTMAASHSAMISLSEIEESIALAMIVSSLPATLWDRHHSSAA